VIYDVSWRNPNTWGLLLFHVGALAVFYTGATTVAVAACLIFNTLRGLGITAGYHRCFAHRSFETTPAMRFVLGFFGSLSLQGGLLWWVSRHREHHGVTETDRDIHSPVAHGLWWGHLGWLMCSETFKNNRSNARDLYAMRELRWLHHAYPYLAVGQIPVFYFIGWLLEPWGTSGLQMVTWAVFISVVIEWHMTFMVNSICHRWGTRRFATADNSRNNFLVALISYGEGWHNNHHRFPYSERQGLRWWEFDLTHYVLTGLSWIGVVWNLKTPPLEEMAAADRARTSVA